MSEALIQTRLPTIVGSCKHVVQGRTLVSCPKCGVKFEHPRDPQITEMGCPGCWKVIVVPEIDESAFDAVWEKRLGRVRAWFHTWAGPPDIFGAGDFARTQNWALDYTPRPGGTAYEIAQDFADEQYADSLKLSESLDKKLDDLAKTALAIGVIVATLTRGLGADTPPGRSPLLIPAAICLIVSVVVAILARRPISFERPLEIRGLLKVADEHPDLDPGQIRALIAASYHVAVIGSDASNAWKTQQLRRSSGWMIAGVMFLGGLLVSSSYFGTNPNSSGSSTVIQGSRDVVRGIESHSSAGQSRSD